MRKCLNFIYLSWLHKKKKRKARRESHKDVDAKTFLLIAIFLFFFLKSVRLFHGAILTINIFFLFFSFHSFTLLSISIFFFTLFSFFFLSFFLFSFFLLPFFHFSFLFSLSLHSQTFYFSGSSCNSLLLSFPLLRLILHFYFSFPRTSSFCPFFFS